MHFSGAARPPTERHSRVNDLVMEDAFDDQNSLIALPTELLVFIFSFLLSVRDRIALLYVSKRIRSVTEVPSLWREFVWHYGSREEHCISYVLKTCGTSIKTLTFLGHVPPPLQTVIRNCHNVVELSLPRIKLDRVQVGNVIQHMQRLQKLDILWSLGLLRLLVISNQLKELTVRRPEPLNRFFRFRVTLNLFLYLLTCKELKFMPLRINIVGIGLDWKAGYSLSKA